MNVTEFTDAIGSAPPAPVYLFCPFKGPKAKVASFEPLLAQRAVSQAVAALVEPSLRDLAYNAYYAEEANPAEIVSVAMTFPFLAERRVIVVNNAEHYESETAAKAIIDYIASPSETTVMFLVAARLDRRSKFYKACEKNAVLVECPELRDRADMMLWINREVASLGKTIEPAAVEAVMARAGNHLSDVSNALQLVCSYIGGEPTVREAHVRAACADVAEEEIWALTNAIAESNTAKAIQALREMIDLGKSEFQILGLINGLLRDAYAVATGRPDDYGLHSYTARRVAPLANKLGVDKIRAAFSLCMDTDVFFRTTGVDRALVLELLVIKLAAFPARRAVARR